MAKINQILAIEKNKKTQLHKEITELHRATQRPELLTGHMKVFVPRGDDEETYPPEERKVQILHQDAIDQACEQLAALMDVTATKDFSNCKARADVILNDQVFLPQVPVTFLLFLEKELTDLQTFVSKMVELDTAQNWTFDPNSGQYRSDSTTSHKTKKLQKPIVHPVLGRHPPSQEAQVARAHRRATRIRQVCSRTGELHGGGSAEARSESPRPHLQGYRPRRSRWHLLHCLLGVPW